jgi:peptidoglycan/xylan/chitin deacetylase (PgdA/CDA1 family)
MGILSKKPLAERETLLIKTVSKQGSLEKQPTQTVAKAVRKKRQKKLLYALSFLLIVLIILGIFLGQATIRSWFSPSQTTNSSLQQILHPETATIHSSGINSIVDIFMQAMLQKEWSILWSMLDPNTQRLWQGQQDFVHFEQSKFDSLTLQSYTTSPTMVIHPWLDPDTTQIYSSVATLQISLLASTPTGLLTDPSNQALKKGLFQRTLFALIQDSQKAWKVLIAGPADLDAPVLVPAKPPVSRLIIPIFMYHHVSSLQTHNPLDYNLTVTTANFDAQLTWLQQQGYHTITMTELFDTFYYGKALPSKPVMLTFDDGYADIYTYALPVLLAHHDRGVFYIISGIIGGNYVTWDQVRSLARSGMEIASHTVHHYDVARPSTGTTQTELLDSKAKLEAELAHPIQFFCYPTGEPFHHDTVAEQQRVLKDLFEDGYLSATLDPFNFNSALQNSQTPYQLPRIRVSGGEILENYIGILNATLAADQYRLKNLEQQTPSATPTPASPNSTATPGAR